MKKILRYVSLILTLLIVCFTFCGCDFIEEARTKHAVWKDDDKTVILLNGKEYKLLPECGILNPMCNSYCDYVVTKSDVPLLLAEMYGELVSVSSDENFIIVDSGYVDHLDSKYEPAKIYCATDCYEEIKSKIENDVVLENLCYEYYYYDADTDDYLTGIYNFTKEDENAILGVIRQGDTTTMDVYAGNTEAYFEIYNCSSDGLFRKNAFDLVLYHSKAYLVCNDYEEGEGATYVVPDELYPTIRKIAEDYLESMDW